MGSGEDADLATSQRLGVGLSQERLWGGTAWCRLSKIQGARSHMAQGGGNKTAFVVVGTCRGGGKPHVEWRGGREGEMGGPWSAVLEARALYPGSPRACPGRPWSCGGSWETPSPAQTGGTVGPRVPGQAGTGSKGRFERQDRWSGVEGMEACLTHSLFLGTLKEQEGHQEDMAQVGRTSVVTPPQSFQSGGRRQVGR